MSFEPDDDPLEDGPPAGAEGLFPPPDGIELILDADGMLCVFDAQRLARVDDHRVAALADRRVVVEEVEDAMAWLHVYAPAVEVHAAHDRITKVAKTVIDADRADADRADADRADADRAGAVRSLDQARTDVLCDLLIDGAVDAHPKSARGIRAGVVVTVPALSLLDDAAADTAPAVVEGVGPVPIGRARQLCGGGEDWMRVLTHPETGIVVSVGRDRYKPPAGLKRLVRWRAARCMTPGCNVPATRCEIDHQDEWTSPTGRVYLVEPERHLPAFTDTTTPDQPTAPF